MKEPAFDAEYRAAKRSAYSQALARLYQMSSAAVSTLGKIMVDQTTPASTRLRAAVSILSHMAKGIELQDIEACVAELERAAEAAARRS